MADFVVNLLRCQVVARDNRPERLNYKFAGSSPFQLSLTQNSCVVLSHLYRISCDLETHFTHQALLF